MKISVPALALAASLLTTTEGCLVLTGVITESRAMMVSLVDNGIAVCSFWGNLHGGQQQWMNCINGFNSWLQLNDGNVPGGTTGEGVCAYATGHGANNYRFKVHTAQIYNQEPGQPGWWYRFDLSARNYC